KTQVFKATGFYSDGSTIDITNQAIWSVDDAMVAAVSNAVAGRGVLTAVGPGSTTVRARLDGREGTAQVVVTDQGLVGLRIMPPNPKLHLDETVVLVANGVYMNGTTQPIARGVSWASSNPAVATITPAGLAHCVAAGQVTITATYIDK